MFCWPWKKSSRMIPLPQISQGNHRCTHIDNLHLHQVGERTYTSELSNMLGTQKTAHRG